MLNTLGDVVTCGLVITAMIFVPWAIFRARVLPHLRPILRFVMSCFAEVAYDFPDTEAVHVPVPSTDAAELQPTAETDDITPTVPPASRHLSDRDLIVLLAVQKTEAGKDRFSANDIYKLIGGSRADVLALVRELRQPAQPQYRDCPGPLAQIQNGP